VSRPFFSEFKTANDLVQISHGEGLIGQQLEKERSRLEQQDGIAKHQTHCAERRGRSLPRWASPGWRGAAYDARQPIAILISASVLSFCGNLQAQTPEGPREQTAGSYIAACRTPAHVRNSKPEVFHGIVDQVVEFLKSNRIVLVSDPSRKMIQSEDVISRETLLNVTKDVGASHLLYLIVYRPTTQWAKITLQCFEVSGKLVWEESGGSGMGAVSGKKGVSRALEKLEKQLMPRMGQPGLPQAKDTARRLSGLPACSYLAGHSHPHVMLRASRKTQVRHQG